MLRSNSRKYCLSLSERQYSSTSNTLFHVFESSFVVAFSAASSVTSPIDKSAALAPHQAMFLCSQYSYYAANGYESNNNNWGESSAGSGSQCTTVESTSNSGVKLSTTWNWQGGQDNFKSYANAGKQCLKVLIVGNIKSLPTSIQWEYQHTDIRVNIAYDIFTAADPNHDISSDDYALLVE